MIWRAVYTTDGGATSLAVEVEADAEDLAAMRASLALRELVEPRALAVLCDFPDRTWERKSLVMLDPKPAGC